MLLFIWMRKRINLSASRADRCDTGSHFAVCFDVHFPEGPKNRRRDLAL
jgi:hypothetical protein